MIFSRIINRIIPKKQKTELGQELIAGMKEIQKIINEDKKEISKKSLITFNFVKPKRNVHSVFIHCSASDNPNHDNIATMTQWHLQRGFKIVGYHYFIRKDGTIENGRSLEQVPAAQQGHNTNSIAICLHGLDINKFTGKQFESLRAICHAVDNAYGQGTIRFRGHREVTNLKTCPVFDYKKVLNLDNNGKIIR